MRAYSLDPKDLNKTKLKYNNKVTKLQLDIEVKRWFQLNKLSYDDKESWLKALKYYRPWRTGIAMYIKHYMDTHF